MTRGRGDSRAEVTGAEVSGAEVTRGRSGVCVGGGGEVFFYVPSVINRFIFGHGEVIYFIMQSLLEKRSENLHCFTYLLLLTCFPS